jgi:hypothetical protein
VSSLLIRLDSLNHPDKRGIMRQSRPARRRRVGITHFPLSQEDRTQQAVPPKGEAKQGGRQRTPAPRKQRTAVREETDLASPRANAVSKLGAKGGKGGKSGGSRAGLLSKRTSDRGRKSRNQHPLDLL